VFVSGVDVEDLLPDCFEGTSTNNEVYGGTINSLKFNKDDLLLTC
jgi:hypothetical protein